MITLPPLKGLKDRARELLLRPVESPNYPPGSSPASIALENLFRYGQSKGIFAPEEALEEEPCDVTEASQTEPEERHEASLLRHSDVTKASQMTSQRASQGGNLERDKALVDQDGLLHCRDCEYVTKSRAAMRQHRYREHPAEAPAPAESRASRGARKTRPRSSPSQVAYDKAVLKNLEASRPAPVELPPDPMEYCPPVPLEPYMGKCRTPNPFK
jgi:hypothetical protein